MRRPRTFRALVAASCMAAACAGPGQYVWVGDLPPQFTTRPSDARYVIRDGDVLSIRVFDQEAMSTKAKVRSDGRIALPALGDIDVRGKVPSELKAEIEARLKSYVNVPSVTVTVEEFQPVLVSVLGEVQKPGTFPLDPHATLAQALASAGGLTDYASRDGIYVVRAGPPALRVRFTWDGVSRGAQAPTAFVLKDGDLVVVE
jgi:polysaccharide export outer membrane protein